MFIDRTRALVDIFPRTFFACLVSLLFSPASFDLYPSLTESDRIRGDLNVRYRQELVHDMFWNLKYFYNFDSVPPPGAESDRDYGLITGLEYQF